ncbi:hypothetical protein LQ772_06645 [Frateuria edaphi]|uniref:hypothetical protein n=1 Tax=Frateuria edaphi TaxID=2898793 RepID=UPI001E47BCF9|nr:hypothetical protein [Frateuria edaphi]UGB46964.1 hypothetical protein LQ772_06645 [Frateuria edaphi]
MPQRIGNKKNLEHCYCIAIEALLSCFPSPSQAGENEMPQEVTFTSTRSGPQWVGEVIDLKTQERVARTTTTYASAETARSAADSMWRAMQAQQRPVAA